MVSVSCSVQRRAALLRVPLPIMVCLLLRWCVLLELSDEELEKELGFKGLQWARACPACTCCSTAQHLTLSKLLPCRSRS